jgi:hypothetical protein
LKTVAQKLVASESFIAKTASGAVSAAQNPRSPPRMPKRKIELSGRKMSGSMMAMRVAMLIGRAISKPRV